jgi:uncharacterized membrane protein YagU involved in acid resistance
MLGTMLYTRKPVSLIRMDKPLQAMAWATIIAGTAKLLIMLLLFWTLQRNSPAEVLQFISSGFLGNQSFAAGFITIPVGIVLHYAIVFSLVWFLWVLYPLTPAINRWKWVTGAVYGLLVWCFVVFVVLPLSYAPQQAFSTEFNGYLLAADILLVGIPIAWVIGRYYAVREKKIAHARELFDPSSIYY